MKKEKHWVCIWFRISFHSHRFTVNSNIHMRKHWLLYFLSYFRFCFSIYIWINCCCLVDLIFIFLLQNQSGRRESWFLYTKSTYVCVLFTMKPNEQFFCFIRNEIYRMCVRFHIDWNFKSIETSIYSLKIFSCF